MEKALLLSYADMILSLHTGRVKGMFAISKPIYIIAIMEAVEWGKMEKNQIDIDNDFIRNRFGQLYEQFNNNRKGFESAFFVRPYFHLCSAPFYHLIWQEGVKPPSNSATPSAKYLRENLLYAKIDDELWALLQEAESREYLKRSIIHRYLTK